MATDSIIDAFLAEAQAELDAAVIEAIHLVELPSHGSRQSYQCPHTIKSHSRGECLVVIHPLHFSATFGYYPSLVFVEFPLRISFDSQHPLRTYKFLPLWSVDLLEDLIFPQALQLSFYSCSPLLLLATFHGS